MPPRRYYTLTVLRRLSVMVIIGKLLRLFYQHFHDSLEALCVLHAFTIVELVDTQSARLS